MPIGYLVTVGVWTVGLVLAVAPLGRSGWRGTVNWVLSAIPNESPFIAAYVVWAATLQAFLAGNLDAPGEWFAVVTVSATLITGSLIVKRSLGAPAATDAALEDGLGPDSSASRTHRLPWIRIVLVPLPILRWSIRRKHNIRYGEAGRYNRLDTYRHRRRPLRGPVLVHLHGGHFHTGRKSFEGRPFLHGLAARGWLCISANYRLQPGATFREQLIDVKKVIAWAHAHAAELGADASRVFVAGSSSGAHLALTAALTAGDPAFQPGSQHFDTSIAGAIGFYGYYGPGGGPRDRAAYTPIDYVGPDAPPVLIASGGQDTVVPAEYTTELVSRLREVSANPVVYVELPSAQHSFDLVHSVHTETLVDTIAALASYTAGEKARHVDLA
jgi:acetyl esterase/lipase